jgi:hypothetical protein
MTALDPTRPRSGDAPPENHDELAAGGDPYHCPACVADGVECEFHRGWAAGWDACAAFVARSVDEQRAAELDPAAWTLWRDDEHDGADDVSGGGPR